MDNEIWLKLIDSLPQIITALGVIIVGWFSYKLRQQSEVTEKKIDDIGINVDGKMDKLLEAREEAAGAKGELKERDAERKHLKDKQ